MRTAEKKGESVLKSTREGRLYIKTEDFFKQEEVQRTIDDLLDSELVRKIEENKKKTKRA